MTPDPDPPLERGPVVWYGGKGRLTDWLREYVPLTPVYVEPYGGGGSLLFARPAVAIEVYNDLDGRLVNLFRALQDPPRCRRLERRIRATFYSRAEFALAIDTLADPDADPDDLAWAFFVAQNQCFGGIAKSAGQWARAVKPPGPRTSAWWSRVADIELWARRLQHVQIEQRDALDVIRRWDGPQATFYLDPPYVHSTRVTGTTETYAVELDDDHHARLVELLLRVEGGCVLSGYSHPIYEQLEQAAWQRVDRPVPCKWRSVEPGRRLESIWINPVAWRNSGHTNGGIVLG